MGDDEAGGAAGPHDVPVGTLEPEPAPAKRKPVAVIAAVAAIVVVAGAVGVVLATRNSGSHSALDVLTTASTRTTGAGTAHVELTSSETVPGGSPVGLRMSGDENFATHDASLTAQELSDTAHVPAAQERVVNGAFYLRDDVLSLPKGITWVAVTPADVGNDAAGLLGAIGNDPSSGLNFLSSIVGTPTKTENTALDDVDVAHYSLVVNLKQAFESTANATEKLGMSGIKDSLEAPGLVSNLTNVPTQAWIDKQGRVRKMQLTISVTQDNQETSVVYTLHFTNFGEPVTVTAPDPSTVVQFSKDPTVFSRMSGSSASS